MEKSNTKNFAFVLGRERDLNFGELKAVLKRFCFDFSLISLTDNVAYFKIAADSGEIASLADILGGTIKIFEVFPSHTDIEKNLIEYIEEEFIGKGKVVFGISAYSPERLNLTKRRLNASGFQIKKELRNRGISTRFIELRDTTEVPSVISLTEKLTRKGVEFGVFTFGLGVLIGLSNPLGWSKRDYGKPAGDKRSGMLPPKLARIMLNLTLENCQTRPLVLDPFCGSGNILLEAMMLGLDVFGSDISEKAVNDTQANIDWLAREYETTGLKARVHKADSTTADFLELVADFSGHDEAVVVTEPYLGEPKKFMPNFSAIRGEYEKVQKLYLDFLTNIKQLHPKFQSVKLCLVFPLVESREGKRFSLFSASVDEIKKMGYTLLQSPYIYGREYQVVKREIVLLELKA